MRKHFVQGYAVDRAHGELAELFAGAMAGSPPTLAIQNPLVEGGASRGQR